MPKISVVSPTYNHAKYLKRSIDSVLNQSFRDFEYIISDDCSTDESLSLLREIRDPRVTVIENDTNGGISANSWRCWERCTGEYLIGFTTDDEWHPNLLQRLLSHIESKPGTVGVFALAEFMNEEGELTGEKWTAEGVGLNRNELLRSIWLQRPVFFAPAALLRSDALHKCGYFPKNLKQINDLAAFVRLLRFGDLEITGEYLARFRQRATSQNASAPTPEALGRFAFEMYHLLFEILDTIENTEELLKTFPEASKYADPAKLQLKEYYAARLAIDFPHASYRMFGLTLLYKLLGDDATAQQLREHAGFNYPDLFRLAGEVPVLAEPAMLGQYEHLQRLTKIQQGQIESLTAQLNASSTECSQLKVNQESLTNSTSWKLTAPLRKLSSALSK